jgi:SMODS and SLOG-associating 2TM effector domain 1/Protein of unknown function (DUF4231)
VLAALAAQIHLWDPADALRLGYLGVAALAVIPVVRQWRLGKERLQGWIMARAASEALKREMYLYRTSSGPYDAANAAETLLSRRDKILGKVRVIQQYGVESDLGPRDALEPLSADSYISERLNAQVHWFRQSASQYARVQQVLSGAEFALTLLGALLGAALTTSGNQGYGAWVAVITTVMGALGAHVAAQRYNELIISYRSVADQLEGILGRWRASAKPLRRLAETCEALLETENQSWVGGADETMQTMTQEQTERPQHEKRSVPPT